MCGKSDSVGPGLWGLAVPLHLGAWGQRWPTAGTLRALGKPGQELSVGPADPMGAVASLRGGGEAGKGQEVSTQGGPDWPRRGDVGSALENTGGYVYGAALRSSGDLGSAARSQARPQCTSVSSAPEGAGPLQPSPPVIGTVPSLVTRPADRGRLVPLRTVLGTPRTREGISQDHPAVSDRDATTSASGREMSRGSRNFPDPYPSHLQLASLSPGALALGMGCPGSGGGGGIGEKAAGSARPGFSPERLCLE